MATIKQKLVASKLVENGGNIGKAMITAGYSPNTAKTPGKLTKSKGWQELMDGLFPDELLLKKHRKLLDAKKNIVERKNGHIKVIHEEIDVNTVIKALDMAYKLKGYYPSSKFSANQQKNHQTIVIKKVSYTDIKKNALSGNAI